MRRLLVLAIACGCGRLSFEARSDSAPDDTSPSDPDTLTDAAVCAASYVAVSGLTSRYRTGTNSSGWLDAEVDCESDGGHLIVPETSEETGYFLDVMSILSATDLWLGLSDHVAEGTVVSVIGTSLPPMWDGTEPNNLNNAEDCVQAFTNGRWNDTACTSSFRYICECDLAPMPVTPTYCDTKRPESCGECATMCSGAQICSATQTCI